MPTLEKTMENKYWEQPKSGSPYEVTKDWRDYPLSKCPFDIKLIRAIHERKSFCNLGSTVATAIRWEGDYYIITVRGGWKRDGSGDFDIAIGRQGEVPFLFRSPFVKNPDVGVLTHMKYVPLIRKNGTPDYINGSYKEVTEEADPKYIYSNYYSPRIVTRLDQLGCLTVRHQTPIKTIVNPDTHRKNTLKANCPCLIVHHSTIETYPVEYRWSDQVRAHAGVNLKEIESVDYKSLGSDSDAWEKWRRQPNQVLAAEAEDEAYSHREFVPLKKWGWYFRNGMLAFEDHSNKIHIADIINR